MTTHLLESPSLKEIWVNGELDDEKLEQFSRDNIADRYAAGLAHDLCKLADDMRSAGATEAQVTRGVHRMIRDAVTATKRLADRR